MTEKVLEVKKLVTKFMTDDGLVTAVDNISFDVFKGQTLGIVGESGSGKSVSALSILRLIPNPPGIIDSGEILFKGEDILKKNLNEMRNIRGNKISMIFQEPMTSLNPVFTIGNQIKEVIKLHQNLKKSEINNRAIEMLRLVGIPEPDKRINEYPHQLSGGMRQRIIIAMSLACQPEVLIADEPTTALDVTIQAQILDLMNRLQQELGMGIIMITHDLGVVAEVCHHVCVMYCGKLVEKANVKELFANPQHPYTQGLIKSIPTFDSATNEKKEKLITIQGVVPPLSDLPSGCSFQNRCPQALDRCRKERPSLKEISPEHQVSCWLFEK